MSFDRFVEELEAADPTLRDRIEQFKREMFGDDEPPETNGVPVGPRPQTGAGGAWADAR